MNKASITMLHFSDRDKEYKYTLSNGEVLLERELVDKLENNELDIENLHLFRYLILHKRMYWEFYSQEDGRFIYDYTELASFIVECCPTVLPEKVTVKFIQTDNIVNKVAKLKICGVPHKIYYQRDKKSLKAVIFALVSDSELKVQVVSCVPIKMFTYSTERANSTGHTYVADAGCIEYVVDVSDIDCSNIVSPLELFPIHEQRQPKLKLIVNSTFKNESAINFMFKNKIGNFEIQYADGGAYKNE